MPDRKPITVPEFLRKKAAGERIVMITAYDYPSALFADRAGVDGILIGDSLGMVVQGHQTTLPVTLDEIIYHTRAVVRAQPRALLVADLPFLTYQAGEDQAVTNAGRILKEGGAAAVKFEGGERMVPLVRRLAGIGIPVMGHLGMTPQSVHAFGGFRVQAREADRARSVLEDAAALEDAGAFGIVLENIPGEVAQRVTASVRIPTIGIGAGPDCDGEVQVFHDVAGLYPEFLPRHAKRFAEGGKLIQEAIAAYADEVRRGVFPAEANTFHAPDLQDPDAWKS